jgi:hypothetical protein
MRSTPWRPLAWRLTLVLGAYSLLRALFLVHNRAMFAEVPAGPVALAFLHGLRFDLSAIAVINAPFVMLSLLPLRQPPPPPWRRFLKALFLITNFPFLAINIIDLEFYQFTGRRFDLTLLGMGGDAGVNWRAVGFYYWPLVLLGVAITLAWYFGYGRLEERAPEPPPHSPRYAAAAAAARLAVAAGLLVLAVRGGFQTKPLSPVQAAGFNHNGLTQLTLNSTFTVIKNRKAAPLKRHAFFDTVEEARAYLRPMADGGSLLPGPSPRDNVVILVVESLSAEYCGAGNGGGRHTPFLDSLAAESLFFGRNYANGRRSMEAMPSILAGLPSLMPRSFMESPYCGQPILGLGTLLATNGYTTSFFHGAPKGTMHFDVFMRLAGVQNYFGLAEYPNPADHDGSWGIFDEPYLQYMARQLTLQPRPFAAVALTLTSHNPYTIPARHQGRFKQGSLPILETIGYADYALERFFETARQQPWYSNTLFVITGDHTQKLETPEYANTLGRYRVPLIFHHPARRFAPADPLRITQHADILPSILDYLGVRPARRLLFGRSVFRRGEGRAFVHENGHYWLVRGGYALDFAPGTPSRLFDLSRDPLLAAPLDDQPERRLELEREARALVQYFNNGLLDGRLYDPVAPEMASSAETPDTGSGRSR